MEDDPNPFPETVLRLRLLVIGCAIVFGGCISSETMRFTAVSVSEVPPDVRVIAEDVVGEDCPKGAGSYGSYAKATKQAIASAPGANALINVRFSRVEKPVAKICVNVTGDAAHL